MKILNFTWSTTACTNSVLWSCLRFTWMFSRTVFTSPGRSPGNVAVPRVHLYDLLLGLVKLMAPVLSFTAEEIWSYLPESAEPESVLLAAFPDPPPNFPDEILLEKWDLLLKVRSEVNRALEQARREKLIGNALEARVTIGVNGDLYDRLKAQQTELLTLTMVSELKVQPDRLTGLESQELPGVTIVVDRAPGDKCERCWFYLPSVGEDPIRPQLCSRCRQILSGVI